MATESIALEDPHLEKQVWRLLKTWKKILWSVLWERDYLPVGQLPMRDTAFALGGDVHYTECHSSFLFIYLFILVDK